jgi:nucleotide-binding universal stress UspA family protein
LKDTALYARIVVALDGSPLAEQILPYVEALGERFGATLILVRATTPPDEVIPIAVAGFTPAAGPAVDPRPLIETEVEEAVEYLQAIAERLRKQGLKVEYEQRDGKPAEVLLEAVRRHRADFLALTTHGHGALLRLVLGSVAEEVVHKAPCPVLLVRAHTEAESQRR